MTTPSFDSTLVASRVYLGKKPARPNAVKFLLRDYIDMDAIDPPPVFGHIVNRDDMMLGMLGNDQCGDCVVAGSMHEIMIWTRAAAHYTAPFTADLAKHQYMLASGWNGVNNDPSDTGLDMQQFAARRRGLGVTDANGNVHRIKAYARIRSWDTLVKATYVFGAAALGIRVPASALSQFDAQQPWSPVAASPMEGGHYVCVVGRNSRGNLVCVTWGRLQAMTRDFVEHYADEIIAYIPGP